MTGVVGGFSAGAAVSVLLLRHFDKPVTAAATTAVPSDQLLKVRDVRGAICEGDAAPVATPSVYEGAVRTCRELVRQTKEEMGIPGVCIAVNVNGKTVWTEGRYTINSLSSQHLVGEEGSPASFNHFPYRVWLLRCGECSAVHSKYSDADCKYKQIYNNGSFSQTLGKWSC